MSAVYADIDQLKDFQEQWEVLPNRLEAAVSERDTLISQTRTALDRGIMEAEEIHDRTRHALQQAQEELDRAKRYEDGDISHLIHAVEQCQQREEWASRQLDKLQAQRDLFDEESARNIMKQDQALAQIKHLGKKGGSWFSHYIDLLLEAKRALLDDSVSASGSFLNEDGSYIGARNLTTEETAQLQQKTGWDHKTLQKCQLRPDGSVWLKTNNSIRDGVRYHGTIFQRDTVMIGDLRVEGVFPHFDALFEPEITMPESLWMGQGDNRAVHFAWCRRQLKEAVLKNPALAARFTAKERQLIMEEKPLNGYTWHHHQQPGKMQLVSSKKHNAAMHGVNHTGGNALWCTLVSFEKS